MELVTDHQTPQSGDNGAARSDADRVSFTDRWARQRRRPDRKARRLEPNASSRNFRTSSHIGIFDVVSQLRNQQGGIVSSGKM